MMKTLIIFIAAVNIPVSEEVIQVTRNYLGIRNLSNDVDEDLPGVVYNGLLTSEEKEEIQNYVLKGTDNLNMIFIEFNYDTDLPKDCTFIVK